MPGQVHVPGRNAVSVPRVVGLGYFACIVGCRLLIGSQGSTEEVQSIITECVMAESAEVHQPIECTVYGVSTRAVL